MPQLLAVDHSEKLPADLSLVRGAERFAPVTVGQFVTEFDVLEHVAGGVRFSHRLHYVVDDRPQSVRVTQEFTALEPAPGRPTGFRRRVTIGQAPGDVAWELLALRAPKRPATNTAPRRSWARTATCGFRLPTTPQDSSAIHRAESPLRWGATRIRRPARWNTAPKPRPTCSIRCRCSTAASNGPSWTSCPASKPSGCPSPTRRCPPACAGGPTARWSSARSRVGSGWGTTATATLWSTTWSRLATTWPPPTAWLPPGRTRSTSSTSTACCGSRTPTTMAAPSEPSYWLPAGDTRATITTGPWACRATRPAITTSRFPASRTIAARPPPRCAAG